MLESSTSGALSAGAAQTEGSSAPEHLDLLVIGAGISGVGAAYHLSTQRAGTRFAVLESQPTFGGTWVTHTFPGIRSDSDLFTFGYRFKPWRGVPIATADEILRYMGEVIEENRLAQHIRYGHRVTSAQWSSAERRWTVQGERLLKQGDEERRERFVITTNFLWMCQGYYRHAQGHTPAWPGLADFKGRLLHPQTWPAGTDLTGQRVVVIGSGATAATLVPALAAGDAGRCAKLTMLQRSPTWYRSGRVIDDFVRMLRELDLPDDWVHEIARRKVLLEQGRFAERAKTEPEAVKQELLAAVKAHLGPERQAEVDRHFTPHYRPWRQRIAFLPDGDLFKAVASGQVAMITDEVERFTPGGIRLKSGAHVEADVVVTATGFELSALGDIPFTIDGKPLHFADTLTWRGAMFTGVPNLMWVFGYIRASWTLRVDLLADFTCRLLAHMQARGATVVVPQLRPQDEGMLRRPWIDLDDFNPGYLQRGMAQLPAQGDRPPWLHGNDYWADKDDLPAAGLEDGTLLYR